MSPLEGSAEPRSICHPVPLLPKLFVAGGGVVVGAGAIAGAVDGVIPVLLAAHTENVFGEVATHENALDTPEAIAAFNSGLEFI